MYVAEGTRRCINLGSYNYLGFAAADEYCTDKVSAALAKARLLPPALVLAECRRPPLGEKAAPAPASLPVSQPGLASVTLLFVWQPGILVWASTPLSHLSSLLAFSFLFRLPSSSFLPVRGKRLLPARGCGDHPGDVGRA